MKSRGHAPQAQRSPAIPLEETSASRPSSEALPEVRLHQRFETQAERMPDRIAVIGEDRQLAYQALNRRANQLARYLQSLGVGPEKAVGLCVERSIEMAVGLLGILKAGGACVPLDPALPSERLNSMLQDTAATVLLTHSRFLSNFFRQGRPVVCLDLIEKIVASLSQENVDSEVTAGNTAQILYTSGSTGEPKGVVATHAGESVWQLPEMAACPLSEEDGFLLTAYGAMGDMFWPWFSGARVIIAPDGGYQDIAFLVDLIAEKRVTFVHFAPSTLRMFLEENLDACNCLKRVRCGGESLSVDLQERFFSRCAAELHNYYALTEAGTLIWHCQRDDTRRFVPIGRPAAYSQVYLLGAHLEPVSIDVPGEIYIGGAEMAQGYLNRPDLTADRFIPNPFDDKPGARLYKTGDLARRLHDGNIEFLGRLDNQVKIRGFRIELGEIESVLSRHPSVREAAAVVHEDSAGHQRLVAYLVPRQETAPTYNSLRSFLEKELPEYMIPSAFVPLASMPRLPNGKADRRGLPAPDPTRPDLDVPFAAPRNPAEEVVAEIWAQVLGLERVGIHDNFFELGGHSLLATQIISRVRQVFQVELPLRSLFEAASVAGLVNALVQIWGGFEIVEQIAQTFKELAYLSEDAIQAMLQEVNGG